VKVLLRGASVIVLFLFDVMRRVELLHLSPGARWDKIPTRIH
jgi:hypothetical protein